MTETEGLRNQLMLLKDPAIAGTVSRYTVADVSERSLSEIDRLRAENAELHSYASSRDAEIEEWRSVYGVDNPDEAFDEEDMRLDNSSGWEARYDNCEAKLAAERKRAEFWQRECEKRAEFLDEVEAHLSGYGFDDDLARLMTMPEEPKP